MPIMAGMKLMPCSSSTRAEGEARIARRRVDADAADGEPEQQRDEALERVVGGDEDRAGQAEAASQKYSNDEKLIANSASTGAQTMRMTTPTSPPSTEKTRLTPRLRSSWPFFDIS